jgi:hypothetical protein
MRRSLDDGLVVRAIGPATESGRISLSELARIASTLQATLERIALGVIGVRPRAGRRPAEIAEAVRMDFVGFSAGSAVLELERADNEALDDLLNDSFEVLADGINEISETGQQPTGYVGDFFTPSVLNGLVRLCGGIGRKNLTSIEFITGGSVAFTLNRETQATLRRIQRSSLEQYTSIVGRLHMGDFDPMTLRCRIDANLGSVSCDFDIDLKDEVFNRLDQLVLATGTAELQSDGATVRLLHLTEISTVVTAQSRSLDDLASEQGITPLGSADELRGEPVDNFDVFLEAIRAARGDE